MDSLQLNAYLAANGIQASNLSAEVKSALLVVLQSASKTAIEQFTKILRAEAERRGVDTTVTISSAARQKAEQDALVAALEEQKLAEQKRKRRIIIGSVAGGLLLLTVALVLWMRRHKQPA